jgi:hypothetical protein
MIIRYALLFLPLSAFLCFHAIGQSAGEPLAVRILIQGADPRAKIEYGGSISTSRADYYLFLIERKELAGTVLVQQRIGTAPTIFAADTSLFPFRDDTARSVEKPVQNAIQSLLQRRTVARKTQAPSRGSSLDSEVSAVGREIDRVIYPISGFRLGSNSTHEILRRLRSGPTVAVDPRVAPPGSIIVSPTQSSPYGPVCLGHAGIVGSDGSIYSADARYGGTRTKNFSLASWLRQFSGTNGSYAFVLRASSKTKVQGL